MKKNSLVFLLFILTCSCAAFSQTHAKKKSVLFFQADKNNIQILPQKFEYTLLDDERIRLGDALIDASKFDFKIQKSPRKDETYNLIFQWPSSLITEGEVTIKDNSGKSIFALEFVKQHLSISTPPSKEDEEDLRNPVATLTVESIPQKIINEIKTRPFFKFCVNKEALDNKMFLCSQDLFLITDKSNFKIRSNTNSKAPATIEINGKPVSQNGILQLNNASESISLKFISQSGVNVEVDSHNSLIDFKNVTTDSKGENIFLSIVGAKPVNEKKLIRLGENEWQTVVDPQTPSIYLITEGGLPLRQDFNIQGPLPKETEQLQILGKDFRIVYADQIDIRGKVPSNVTLKSSELSESAFVEKESQNMFKWHIGAIPKGQKSRHYLTIESNSNRFTAGIDLNRGFSAKGYAGLYSSSNYLIAGRLGLQWWSESLLGIKSESQAFRLGINIERSQQISSQNGIDQNEIQLLYRNKAGLQMSEPTSGIFIPIQLLQSAQYSATLLGLGYFTEMPAPEYLKTYFYWTEAKVAYLTGGSNDLNFSSRINIQGMGYKQLSSTSSLRFGAQIQKDSTKNQTGLGLSFTLNLDWVWMF